MPARLHGASVAVAIVVATIANAAEPADSDFADHRAILDLFGPSLIADNHAEVLRRAETVSQQQAYDMLAAWVLPGAGHGFRMSGEIRRTPFQVRPEPEVTGHELPRLADYPEARWIRSPATELVRLAAELGRLNQLREQVEQSNDADPQIVASDKIALATLIEIASGDMNAVAARLEERFAAPRDRNDTDAYDQHWLDLLVLWSLAEHPELCHLMTADLFGVYQWDFSEDLRLDVVVDYLRLLEGRCRTFGFADSTPATPNAKQSSWEQQWTWFSRSDSMTHSLARPLTRFVARPAGIFKASGHERDYLLYRCPITGPIDVRSEFGSQYFAFATLILNGTSVFPHHTDDEARIGGFAKRNRVLSIEPRLETRIGVSEARAYVRDDRLGFSFNGRELFQRPTSNASVPWVGLRSWRRTYADIRSVDIHGAVPVTGPIDLLSDVELDGWFSYFQPEVGEGLGHWTTRVDREGRIHLVSRRGESPEGSFDECLLRYAIPLRYDATIEFEFLYKPGQSAVSPCFGRRAFLIEPTGVKVHQLTDGRYEANALRPNNAMPPQGSTDDGIASLPIKDGWNLATLKLADDSLELYLNHRRILKESIDAQDSRFFGLLHFSDQTSAEVRNATLQIDPKPSPPGINEQSLAAEPVRSLDRSAESIPIAFQHDFRDGYPTKWFSTSGNEQLIQQTEDGIGVTRSPEVDGVHSIGLSAIFDGDFDVTIGYTDLKLPSGKIDWHCGIGLEVDLENATRNRCGVYRRRDRMHGQHVVSSGRKDVKRDGKFSWSGGTTWVGESPSGRLRLARRGNVIYSLHATRDGAAFLLIDQIEIPPGPIAANGIKLVTNVANGQEVAATWTTLTVRATEKDLMDVKDSRAIVERLDRRRAKLEGESIDLTTTPYQVAGIAVSTVVEGEVEPTKNGLLTTAQGSSNARNLTMYKSCELGEQFDVQIDFKSVQMDPDRTGNRGGEVMMQLYFAEPGSPAASVDQGSDPDSIRFREASFIFRRRSEATYDLRPRFVGRGPSGNTIYLPLRTIFNVPVDQFRIAQIDKTIYFLASTSDDDRTYVVAAYKIKQPLTPAYVVLSTVGSPDGGTTRTYWKSVQLYGDMFLD